MISSRFILVVLSLLPVANASAAEQARAWIFTPPPLVWDRPMGNSRPALAQTATDFANLAGGIRFGMTQDQVNALMPEPIAGLSWRGLPQANEFPDDVRYFWVRMGSAGPLRLGLQNCTGAGSYLVFLFTAKGLFRLSYRLLPDNDCPAVLDAAREIFARYITISQQIALAVRYRTGQVEVVDITDAAASYLMPIRWGWGGK